MSFDSATSALTRSGALIAMAAILGVVESITMPAGLLPGVRLGLSNIPVLLALYTLGEWRALSVSIGRVLIVGLATGSLLGPAGLMSAVGALAAWAGMVLGRRLWRGLSVVGWSILGAAVHVASQLSVAAILTGSAGVLFATPLSLTVGAFCGLGIGLVSCSLLSRDILPSMRTHDAIDGVGADAAAATG